MILNSRTLVKQISACCVTNWKLWKSKQISQKAFRLFLENGGGVKGKIMEMLDNLWSEWMTAAPWRPRPRPLVRPPCQCQNSKIARTESDRRPKKGQSATCQAQPCPDQTGDDSESYEWKWLRCFALLQCSDEVFFEKSLYKNRNWPRIKTDRPTRNEDQTKVGPIIMYLITFTIFNTIIFPCCNVNTRTHC